MKFKRISIISTLFLIGVFALVKADNSALPPSSAQQDVTYGKDIRPIFEENCFRCHGEKKQKSELRLDTVENVLKGGKHGPDVVASKSDQSPLINAVARLDKKTAMPPKGDPLTAEQVGLIRAWIDQGAK